MYTGKFSGCLWCLALDRYPAQIPKNSRTDTPTHVSIEKKGSFCLHAHPDALFTHGSVMPQVHSTVSTKSIIAVGPVFRRSPTRPDFSLKIATNVRCVPVEIQLENTHKTRENGAFYARPEHFSSRRFH